MIRTRRSYDKHLDKYDLLSPSACQKELRWRPSTCESSKLDCLINVEPSSSESAMMAVVGQMPSVIRLHAKLNALPPRSPNLCCPETSTGSTTATGERRSIVVSDAAMPPVSVRQRRNRNLGEREWEEKRQLITYLYQDMNMKLEDLIVVMRDRHDFNATSVI